MRISTLFFFACLAGTAVFAQNAQLPPAAPEVHTQQGVVRGSVEWQHTAIFQGIPYAAPPVADLRWRPPQAPAAWTGVRDATKPPHSCMQIDWGWNTRDAHDESEDCLYLNIATPSLHPAHPLPVLFWIHGGANYNGSGRYAAGQTLTQHGVVLVSINYRLGIFGFLALPQLTAESLHHSSGNYALLDQIAALRWVRDNIAQFGGNPRNVSIAGQSAGAIDVGMLLTTPGSRGLFEKAIDESGGPIAPEPILPTLAAAESLGQTFAAFAGAPAGSAQVAALRGMSAADLLDAGHRFTAPDKEGVPTHQGPELIVDGWVLPSQPAAAIRDGASHAVPLLIGSNIQEFSFSRSSVIQTGAPPDPPDALRSAIERNFGLQATAAIAAYGLAHSDAPPVDPQLGSAGTQLMTDTLFRCPARIAGAWLAHRGVAVWEYQFERPLPGSGSPSTRHSGELPYVFGWAQQSTIRVMGATFGPADAALSQQMQGYWTNFAKTGNPNGPGLPPWSGFSSGSPGLMHFTADGTSAAAPAAPREPCTLLQTHIEQSLPAATR
ncbi:MAG TPA: carboxylesterase family protein [Acidobacteriaceae bacterium]